MIYAFLATGFEETEAIAPIDVMRRAGLTVKTISITGDKVVVGSHGIGIVADALFEDTDFNDSDMLFLPGGLPGSTNLDAFEPLRKLILDHDSQGKPLAAICAAPQVYGHLGLAQGKKMTCYPGCESHLEGAEYTAALVERDGMMFTGKGPAASLALGYEIVAYYKGEEAAAALREGMMYNDLFL